MRTNNILIIGNYGAGNLGDDAIFAGICADLQNIGYKGKISLMHGGFASSEDTYSGFEKYPFLPSGIKSKIKGPDKGSLRAIAEADLIIFGGGGLFIDEESIFAPLIWKNQVRNKPYIIYSQSVGPLNSFISRFLTAKVFGKASSIHLRDKESVELLKSIGVANETEYSTDAALTWAKSLPGLPKENLMLISLRLWKGLDSNSWRSCLKACTKFAAENNMRVKLLAMDLKNRGELEALKNTGLELIVPKSATEAFEWVSRARILCSMRLHAGIFALAAATPVLMLSYSQKVNSFFSALNIKSGSEVLEMRAGSEDIYRALAKLFTEQIDLDLDGPIKKNQAFLARALR